MSDFSLMSACLLKTDSSPLSDPRRRVRVCAGRPWGGTHRAALLRQRQQLRLERLRREAAAVATVSRRTPSS